MRRDFRFHFTKTMFIATQSGRLDAARIAPELDVTVIGAGRSNGLMQFNAIVGPGVPGSRLEELPLRADLDRPRFTVELSVPSTAVRPAWK